MGKHLNKTFSDREVVDILHRYLIGEIGSREAQDLLKIKRRRFFDILKIYRDNPKGFTLASKRKKSLGGFQKKRKRSSN